MAAGRGRSKELPVCYRDALMDDALADGARVQPVGAVVATLVAARGEGDVFGLLFARLAGWGFRVIHSERVVVVRP